MRTRHIIQKENNMKKTITLLLILALLCAVLGSCVSQKGTDLPSVPSSPEDGSSSLPADSSKEESTLLPPTSGKDDPSAEPTPPPPSKPDVPTVPDVPTESVEPSEPTEPIEPSEPVEPSLPSDPIEPSEPENRVINASGHAVSDTGTALNLWLDWTIETLEDGSYKVSAVTYLDSYSLMCGKRTNSNRLVIDNVPLIYSTPAMNYSADSGRHHTKFAEFSVTYGADELPEKLTMSADWFFAGTYSGISINTITVETTIDTTAL